ncbi:hypothetical protein FPZ12_015850 [Amycolatopsis acidicola]|uniref:Uncharacterized protein n=1 Tax=Amycolatopsis acidicola TaxID=2596893 RepID=A0A5N0V8M9_9PSEU|nr:hypothetical protein [Amycolatopsis acidicola]KAA9160882.1 hypothetical protein FPZ12_015850 [Amycolatopsis acidicola]
MKDLTPAWQGLGGGIVETRAASSGCQYWFADHRTFLQIRMWESWNRMDEVPRFVYPVTLAGIPGRATPRHAERHCEIAHLPARGLP